MTSPASKSLRQGLPRIPGGEPWPPASAQRVEPQTPVAADPAEVIEAPRTVAASVPTPAAAPEPAAETPVRALRQGLPRVAGGDPWPPTDAPANAAVVAEPRTAPPHVPAPEPAPAQEPAVAVATEPVPTTEPAPAAASIEANGDSPTVRQGLPRVAGGDPWPPSSFVAAPLAIPVPAKKAEPAPAVVAAPVVEPAIAVAPAPAPEAAPSRASTQPPASTPEPAPAPKAAASKPTATEPKRHGPLTTKQWVLAGVLGAFCALGMATAVVLVARGIASIDSVEAFIQRYPGEYHLPESAPVGVPAWLAWNHFFNFFLMVLIIRSGLLVRHQKKPPAYWSSKRSPKVSINLWLHQSLDLLWIINGLVFIIVLFASGHWMRIVPTSWEVFPNAISAALQYLTLDWPTENGWVNYNSLQQLAYFITVFIAAPLAVITGFRLSAFWPKNPALAKNYPIELARAVHFPTMIYFVLFIVVHVILVFSTGALRNLNHMYAAQGSTDPTKYADNWTGLLFFALSLMVIAGAWFACRPMVLSSIAGLFGKVSSR
ncbi:hypothetical protein AQ436_15660 [Arthrobacter sp. EpRS66]|nr:hypothetical protein AQ436_15660 [Arthrobacter sp. EpRS66]